ncbi:MAG: DUF3726 domain-containing protein [Granulosicoccus sp.]
MSDSEICPSLNEVASLAKRAVRGAGMSWGIAEEAASSVRWLSARTLPGPELLAGLLFKQQDFNNASLTPNPCERGWVSAGEHICPLLAAAAFSDDASVWRQQSYKRVVLNELAYPLLLLPAVARVAALTGVWLHASWDTITISTDGQSVCIQGPLSTLVAEQTSRLICSRAQDTVTLQPSGERQCVDRYSWGLLESFAHRTYAPATEESRRLGAGSTSKSAGED